MEDRALLIRSMPPAASTMFISAPTLSTITMVLQGRDFRQAPSSATWNSSSTAATKKADRPMFTLQKMISTSMARMPHREAICLPLNFSRSRRFMAFSGALTR